MTWSISLRQRPRALRLVLVLAGMLGTLASAPDKARAEKTDAIKDAAQAATREGNKLLDDGHAEEALAKFQEAHRLVGGYKLQYNFGQAYQVMPGHESLAGGQHLRATPALAHPKDTVRDGNLLRAKGTP